MKTDMQILEKIKEHEQRINEILETDREYWDDRSVRHIESYLIGRKALLWVLSGDELLEIDEYEKKAKYECLCHDSTKIF